MNEEEKKAIEYLNMYADNMENRVYDGDTTWNIKRVLNLIEKQQKEIELAKQSLKENANIADERNQLLVENQKKEKMIDLIANEIASFRKELDLGNDTKEAVIDEYRKYIELLGVVFEKKVGE